MNNPNTTKLSPNQQALLKIRDLKQQVEQLKASNAKSAFGGEIAIVSMACRFPRTSNTPETFWKSLIEKTDQVGTIPEDRWDLDAFYDSDPETPGKMYATNGVFLDDLDRMDPEFFGIAPREATWVDPQQRLLLETGYEAIERAGWPAEKIAENTGVFVGWMHNDYQNEASDSFLNLNPYIATGAAGSFLCGRLAYYLGLQGPSIAIDTACSSSLVAIHLACQSLQRRDCDQALVGGVNTILSPTTNILTCKLKALSPTGQSRAFDAAADGYLRGEGCGVVTLKRLEDAQRDGDPVLGVIRGSAVGHNGFSSGLTAPNPKAQEKVIRAALARAGVAPEEVGYLEAHGTGTELGDPIEMQAAAAALAAERSKDQPLLVGSVKTNIGHLEAAAGMAGLIKVLLAMQHNSIPGQLNFETPNPHIAWDKMAVKVLTEQTQWPNPDHKVAGVSAFGMSGTNAHLVIEAPPSHRSKSKSNATSRTENDSIPHLILLSGKSEESVKQLASDFARDVAADGGTDVPENRLRDMAFTSSIGRSHFEHRGAIVAKDASEAADRLKLLERGAVQDGVFAGHQRVTPKIAWQFTGQGSQYVDMARGLYSTWPVFKQAIDQCDQWLTEERADTNGKSLLAVMFDADAKDAAEQDDGQLIHQTQWTQPAIFAVQMGLAKLLSSWGLKPDAVLGHSVGQYAAACVAGVMSWHDGLKLISHRGRLIGELPAGGQMMAVFAKIEDVSLAVEKIDGLALAANNVSHIAVSGPVAAIDAAEKHFADNSIRTKRLRTSHAFHSQLMDPALGPFEEIANGVTFSKPTLPLICNVSGTVLPPDTVLNGSYWADHIRQPVQFSDSITAAEELGCGVLLELGPHAVLSQMAAGKWNSKGNGGTSTLISCLHRTQQDKTQQNQNQQDNASIVNAMGALYANGITANFESLYNSRAAATGEPTPQRVVLPTYPFQRRRFWGPDKPRAAHALHHTAHPLLGSPVELAGSIGEQRFQSHVETDSPTWLPDHEVMGQVVMPGAAFVEMALEAARVPGAKSNGEIAFAPITDIKFEQPFSPTARTAMQTVIKRVDGDNKDDRRIETWSAGDATGTSAGTWARHFTANIAGKKNEAAADRPAPVDLKALQNELTETVDAENFYSSMDAIGLSYGAAFQTIDTIQSSSDRLLVKLSSKGDIRGYTIAPPLLDGAIHSLAVGILNDDAGSLFLPVSMNRVQFYGAVESEIWCLVEWTQAEGATRTANLTLISDEGNVVAEIKELTAREIDRNALRKMSQSGSERLLYEMKWQSFRLPPPSTPKRRWLLVGDTHLVSSVASKLTEEGHDAVCVALREGVDFSNSDGHCVLDGGKTEHWAKLFAPNAADSTDSGDSDDSDDSLTSTNGKPWVPEGILWCCADDQLSTANATHDASTIAPATRQHTEGLLNLISAMADAGIRRLECGLQLATAGAIDVEQHPTTNATDSVVAPVVSEPVDVHQSQYHGLGRVIGAEQPELRCRLIDLDRAAQPEDSTNALFDFLTTETADSQCAVRGGEFFVPRLKQIAAERLQTDGDSSAPLASKEAAYLITGGLGGLGRLAGKWLADNGAGQVILVSRRAPDEATQSFLETINETGCRAIVHQADLGIRADVESLFARFGDDLMPLKGVIHAAGVLDDGLIGDQTWTRFENVLSPKIIGGQLLHEFTRQRELDFFVLYSSASSVLGSPGQSNYAMANAFLDGLAWQRRAEGLPAVSINWGPWDEGMAADPRIAKRLAMQGITALQADECHDAMAKMLRGGIVQTTVMDVDWRRMTMGLGGETPSLLEGLAPARRRSGGGDSEFVSMLRKLKGPARRAMLLGQVENLLQEILSTDGKPETDRPLIEMGLDSLMAVEFGTSLQHLLGDSFAIAPTMLFDHPTIDAITDHVLELVEETDAGDSSATATKTDASGSSRKPVRTASEDIAIVGLSCRFPGAHDADEFWQNLLDGVDAVREIPNDRWNIDQFYSADRDPGKMYTKRGGFLDDIGDFDASFFNLSPEEACWIDPQHRMLLEHSYRALEHAQVCPSPLEDNNVGVFMGIMGQDYAFLPKLEDPEIVAAFQGAGLSHSAGVGRISYYFGFEGPSVAVDTASSSSLVALYQAMRSLQEGACNMALAGGVNAILAPVNSLLMSKAGLLSPDGRCKSFSAEADGFGRGEGCGVVVLKRLSDAQANGDQILAVVKGGAVSHNGFSGGITAPSGKAQARVLADALKDAGVAPNEVQYLEAHGTGTEYGDPMEIAAAAGVYGKGRSADNPLLVGSVKANISHLEAAGGVSGLIKTTLAIHHGVIPKQLHFDQPSPHVPWDRMPVSVVKEQQSWPEVETRLAGLTALGLVGTNAHIVLSSAPEEHAPADETNKADDSSTEDSVPATGLQVDDSSPSDGVAESDKPELLLISGKDATGLIRVAEKMQQFLTDNDADSTADLAAICHAAAVGRRHFDYRLALNVASKSDAAKQLSHFCSTADANELPNPVARNVQTALWFDDNDDERGKTVTALQSLINDHAVVRDFVAECSTALETFGASDDWKTIVGDAQDAVMDSLDVDDLNALDGAATTATDVQLFVLHASVAKLWQHWGLEPDAVAGIGVGQYAAACAAGGLCFFEALTLVAARQRCRSAILQMSGANLPQLNEDDALPEEVDNHLSRFEAYADQLNFYPPNRTLVCSRRGTIVPVYQSLAGSYWRDHCLDDVSNEAYEARRANTLETLAASSSPMVVSCNATQSMGAAAAELYCGGVNFVLKNMFDNKIVTPVNLPAYPFKKQRYWITEISDHQTS